MVTGTPKHQQKYDEATAQHQIEGTSTALQIVTSDDNDRRTILIAKIRDAFVHAPAGECPKIAEIMRQHGLHDPKGRPAGRLSEAEIRAVMREEDWKQLRADRLHDECDLIPQELQLRSAMWSVEIEKTLFQALQLQHDVVRSYIQNGVVTSSDGSRILDYAPELRDVAVLAEALRRVSQNVQTLVKAGAFECKPEKNGSLVNRAYLNRLSKMAPEEVKIEIQNMSAMAELLERSDSSEEIRRKIKEHDDV